MTYPTISPKLTLDFANSRQLDPRITFSRSSSATYVHPDTGLITTAPDGVARFEKEGLLIEEARTNNFQYSTELGNAYWDLATGLTKTANNAVSPDGNTTALLVTEDTSTGEHVFGKSVNVSVSFNCMGIFVKPNGKTRVGFRQGGESTANVIFDLSGTGSVVSGNGFIEQYPNGWFRVTQSRQSTGNKTYFHLLNDADDALSYTGDGTSGCWIWGYQKEAGAFPTSLIPTAGSTVTRAADVVSITGTNFSDWYNGNEGTFVAHFDADGRTGAGRIIGSNAGQTPMYLATDAIVQSFGNVVGASVTVSSVLDVRKAGITYESSAQQDALAVDGGTPNTSTNSGNFAGYGAAITTSIQLFSYPSAPSYTTGTISRLSYYDRRVSDAALQALTS